MAFDAQYYIIKAAERMADQWDTVPVEAVQAWHRDIAEGEADGEECHSWPMWGWLSRVSNASERERIAAMLRPLSSDDDDDDDDDTPESWLSSSGWMAVGDTGIIAREFGGELWLGVDGAGYSFRDEHYVPLYRALGYKWHVNLAADDIVRDMLTADQLNTARKQADALFG